MFRPAGSRLPWKSFHARTCRSVVRSLLPLPQVTDTLSDRVLAPAMVTAPAGEAPTTASGAASTAPRPAAIRPARTPLELTIVRITLPPLAIPGAETRGIIAPYEPCNVDDI